MKKRFYLVVLLEANHRGPFTETSTAHVQTVRADDTATAATDAAPAIESALCITPRMGWNEVSRHWKKDGQTVDNFLNEKRYGKHELIINH